MRGYFALLSTLITSLCFSSSPPMNNARLLLTHLRGGDYAHAGDKEAVDMVIQRALELAPEIQEGPSLDLGSGFGGTAGYLDQIQFKSIYGIDIDEAATEYAKKRYLDVDFITGNANQVSTLFKPDFFAFIYLFNVFYAIEDKQLILKQLFEIAKSGALLVLFDYTIKESSFDLNDLAGKPMYPLVLKDLTKDLELAGWEILEITDLSDHFLLRYEDLLVKMEIEHESLSNQFSQEDILKVKTTFNTLLDWLKTSLLGGSVVYARKSR